MRDFFSGKLIYAVVFLGGICLLGYVPSVDNPFMIDDYDLFLENPLTQSPKLLLHSLLPDIQKYLGMDDFYSSVYYRPICHFLPMVEYLLFNKNSFPYHLINLILLWAIGVTAFITFRLFLRDALLAFLTALLFCVHPINSMIVNYVSSAYLEIEILTMLGSVFYFLKTLETPDVSKFYLYFVSIILCLVAMLTHETAFILPFYIVFAGIWFSKDIRRVLKLCWPFFVILGAYFIFRIFFAGIKASLFDKIFQYDGLSFTVYLATLTKLLAWYIAQILVAPGIVLVWMTPLVKSFLGLWISGLVFVGFTIFYLIKRWGFSDIKSMAIFWFVLGVFPLTIGCMFNPSAGFIIEPHWFFFASFGIFILIAQGCLFLKTKVSKLTWWAGICIFLLFYLFQTWHYDWLWGNELRYCQYWDTQVQGNKAVKFHVGNAAMREGNKELAKIWFKESLAGIKSDWQIYTNLGLLAMQENDHFKAEEYFQKALFLHSSSHVVYNNLGVLRLDKSNFEEAKAFFEKASQLNRFSLEPKLNLALVYEKLGNYDRANILYRKVYEHDPRDERALYALLRTSLQGHGQPEMISHAIDFLVNIENEKFLNELGGLLALKGYMDGSLQYFLKSIKLYPKSPDAYREIGKVLANAGYFKQAVDVWNEGLKVNPQDEILRGLLKELAGISAGKN